MSRHEIPLEPGPFRHTTDLDCPCGPRVEDRRRDDGAYGPVVVHRGRGEPDTADEPEE